MSAKEINKNLLDDLIGRVRIGGDFSSARHQILFWLNKGDQLQDEIARLQVQVEKARDALKEIGKGEGAFSRDPLTHASNAIENMVNIARRALNELEADQP